MDEMEKDLANSQVKLSTAAEEVEKMKTLYENEQNLN